jgi:small subunit ribosomal protein S20
MPIKKSAKKNLRKAEKRRQRNLKRKKKIKGLVKKIKAFLEEKRIKEAKKILPLLYKALDKAAKTRVIKKNTAARKKSKFAKLLLRAEKQISQEKA